MNVRIVTLTRKESNTSVSLLKQSLEIIVFKKLKIFFKGRKFLFMAYGS